MRRKSGIYNRLSALHMFTVFLLAILAAPACSSDTTYTFQQLLDDASLVLVEPEGFVEKEPEENTVLAYEHALQHQTK